MKSQRHKQNLQSQQQHKKNIQVQKRLALVLKNYQKQLQTQQDIKKCYQQNICNLEGKVNALKSKLVAPKKIQQVDSNIDSNFSFVSKNNQKIKQPAAQIRYTNHLKFKDLKEDLQKISKQIKKMNSNSNTKTTSSISMTQSKLFTNASVMMKSKIISSQKRRQNSQQMDQTFPLKEQSALAQLLNSSDDIISNLCKNMLVQQELFCQNVQKLQNIQIEQTLMKQLKALTLKNQTQIYRISSNERKKQFQQVQKRRSQVRFGYTQQMKELIRAKKYLKVETKKD